MTSPSLRSASAAPVATSCACLLSAPQHAATVSAPSAAHSNAQKLRHRSTMPFAIKAFALSAALFSSFTFGSHVAYAQGYGQGVQVNWAALGAAPQAPASLRPDIAPRRRLPQPPQGYASPSTTRSTAAAPVPRYKPAARGNGSVQVYSLDAALAGAQSTAPAPTARQPAPQPATRRPATNQWNAAAQNLLLVPQTQTTQYAAPQHTIPRPAAATTTPEDMGHYRSGQYGVPLPKPTVRATSFVEDPIANEAPEQTIDTHVGVAPNGLPYAPLYPATALHNKPTFRAYTNEEIAASMGKKAPLHPRRTVRPSARTHTNMGMHAYPSQGTPTHLTQQFSSIQGTEQHVKAAFYDGSADAPVLDLPVVMLTALTVTVADDSRTPDAKSLNLLQQTVQKYKADRSAVLQIQAYMDVTAPDEGTARRKALGRAIAVRSHILEMGIPNYRISLEVIQPDLFAQNDTLVVAVMRDKQKAQRLAAWDARQQKRQAAKAAQQANSIPSPQTRAPQPAATPTLQQEIEQDAELTYAEDAIIQGGNDFSISVDETLQAPAADETRQSTYAPAATPFAQGAVVEVVFPPQSSQVPDAAKPMLDQLANMLSANADQRVILQAFASLPDGEPAQVARRLSLARAQSVRQYLKSLGIDNRRITMRALGNQGGPMAPDRVDVVLN